MRDGYRGYRFDLEDRAALGRLPVALHTTVTAGHFQAPAVINHRPWLAIKDQGQTESCIGHAGATGVQIDTYLETEGRAADLDLSAWYAYLVAQVGSGTFGQDQGAAVGGAIREWQERGFCLTAQCPTPAIYSNHLSPRAIEVAKTHRPRHHFTPIRSYVGAFRFISSGLGAVLFGAPITEEYQQCSGVLEGMGGRELGLHGQVAAGYTSRRDANGYPYLDCPGSWGTSFGQAGWIEYSPAVFDQLLRDRRSVAIGLSSVPPFQPPTRRLEWLLRHGVF